MHEIYQANVTRKNIIVCSLTAEQANTLLDALIINTYFDAAGNEFFYASEMNPDLEYSRSCFSIVLLEPKNSFRIALFVTRLDACQYVRAFDIRLFTKGQYENCKILYIVEEK